MGWIEVYRRINHESKDYIDTPVVLVAGTRHYSIPKSLSILGLGDDNLINIPIDEDARMDCEILEKKLKEFKEKRRPVLCVVSIMGTTEEGSVDPLYKILEIRNNLQKDNFYFSIHADAAWGDRKSVV